MSNTNPFKVYSELKEAYLRYVDTAYWLRSEELMSERRALLAETDLLFTDVLLEPVLPYDATVELDGVLDALGADQRVGRIVGEALFGGFRDGSNPLRLRSHQADALRQSLQPGVAPKRNVVVTSGTGSGKTESFLLPVLARIVAESLSWPPDGPVEPWWDAPFKGWHSSRSRATRPAAVRAFILYPTNALVEDQITRLRKALRVIAGDPEGRQLWFGRYTGATLGSGEVPSGSRDKEKVNAAARELRETVSEYDELRDHRGIDLAQFADPRQGEMLTRWEMVTDPPDILVTNYSMLNAMLMRDIENPMFAMTRDWLKGDSSNVLSLVVDELHLYRGTQGSEVAMIVRNLLSRLGLEPESPQLRCIATSASLTDDAAGLDYLEQFFGVDRESFFVTAGRPRELAASLPISRAAVLETWNGAESEQRALALRSTFDLPAITALACKDEHGSSRATPLAEVSANLFDEPDDDGSALEAVLEALSEIEPGPESVPLRAHMFVRTLRGVWACTNPICDQVDRSTDLGIGRLFTIPASTCACGGRCPRAALLLRVRRHQRRWLHRRKPRHDRFPDPCASPGASRTRCARFHAAAPVLPLVPTRTAQDGANLEGGPSERWNLEARIRKRLLRPAARSPHACDGRRHGSGRHRGSRGRRGERALPPGPLPEMRPEVRAGGNGKVSQRRCPQPHSCTHRWSRPVDSALHDPAPSLYG